MPLSSHKIQYNLHDAICAMVQAWNMNVWFMAYGHPPKNGILDKYG